MRTNDVPGVHAFMLVSIDCIATVRLRLEEVTLTEAYSAAHPS